MFPIFQFLFSFSVICVVAFDNSFINGDMSQEMIEHGRSQYQLLKERGNLPHYGDCWKGAVEHINEGCRYLSEEMQSDIALHITNCFLEMSGLETYNCGLDKKPNVRSICISSMSDRAFNVYTEFYTHTQNICWFLRGQIWHETISENTFKVGKQLEMSSKNQEHLLQTQKESLEIQQKMLQHGKFLEQVMEDLYISVKAHQELINVMAKSLTKLQSFLVGEISWLDSLLFYVSSVILIFLMTSTKRTQDCRLLLFLLMFANFLLERFLCTFISFLQDEPNVNNLYSYIYDCVWYARYTSMCLICVIFIYKVYKYEDIKSINNKILLDIRQKTNLIIEKLDKKINNQEVEDEPESDFKKLRHSIQTSLSKNSSSLNNVNDLSYFQRTDYKENISRYSNFATDKLNGSRYNLRSRTGTPDSVRS